MLALGVSYPGILRALDDESTKLDPRDRVTIDSIRNHTSRHFPVQQIARATYREILERRAEQNQVDCLMRLLGHESMATSQRYVVAAGTETKQAAAQNRLYDLLP
jgi:integrase